MTTLTLVPMLQYYRDSSPNVDYLYRPKDESTAWPPVAISGYQYQGIAFMASLTAGTLPDGTTLIPLFRRLITHSGAIFHFYTTDPNEATQWPLEATYHVLPNASDRYGSVPLQRWRFPGDAGLSHYYSTLSLPPSAQWIQESNMGNVCPVRSVRCSLDVATEELTTMTLEYSGNGAAWVNDGTIDIYPSTGSIIQLLTGPTGDPFAFTQLSVNGPNGLQWNYSAGNTEFAGSPFKVLHWSNSEVVLVDEDPSPSADVTYEYAITVTSPSGQEFIHDPKFINRTSAVTRPRN